MTAYFLSLNDDTPTSGYWDYALLEELLTGFTREEVRSLPECESAIVVLPARSHADKIDEVNTQLAKIGNVVLFLMGDEEHVFPVERINHGAIHIWIQNPLPGRHDKYRHFGCGYTPHIRNFDSRQLITLPKQLGFFFAGQITHSRREEIAAVLRTKEGRLLETAGFTQGYSPSEYASNLASAKTAPCPSGPVTPDTFRVYEALELGCVPIADEATPTARFPGFWDWMFGEKVPFPTYITMKEFTRALSVVSGMYPLYNNRIQAWWFRKKAELRHLIHEDASFVPEGERDVTIIIPVSPISSHPDTSVLEETVKNARYHFKTARIIITFDGVRKEQDSLYEAYQEHVRRVLSLSREWGNVVPLIFPEHTHQVGMAREAMKHVKTPLIIYCEQDTPLVIDEPIEWEKLIMRIKEGAANVIRFHFEGIIPSVHNHLMLGHSVDGLTPTIQWSQRPHLASADFYRWMLETHFSDKAKCFIEDKIHGCVQDDYGVYGTEGYLKWKLWIYTPNEDNIKRSYHIDGRHGGKKYDETQIW